jgi:hypothetical protein
MRPSNKKFSLSEFVISVVFAVVFGCAAALLFAEWMVGCGEYYVDSQGKKHANECLFLNLERKLDK